MSNIDRVNIDLLGTNSNNDIADEMHNRAGSSSPWPLVHDYFYASTVVIRTAPSGGGSLLVLSTDYTIGALNSDLTARAGVNINGSISLINYLSVDLYYTYHACADIIDAADRFEYARNGYSWALDDTGSFDIAAEDFSLTATYTGVGTGAGVAIVSNNTGAGTGSNINFTTSASSGTSGDIVVTSAENIQLNSAASGADAIDINATVGGIDIDTVGDVAVDASAGDIVLTTPQAVSLIQSGGTGKISIESDGSIDIISAAFESVNIAAAGPATSEGVLVSSENLINFTANYDSTSTGEGIVLLSTAQNVAGTSGNVSISTSTGTGTASGSIVVNSGNAITIDSVANSEFDVTGANLTLKTTASGDVILNSADAVDIDATAASAFTVAGANLTLETTASGNVVIDSASAIDIDAAAASSFTVTNNSLTLNTLTGGNIIVNSAAGIDIDAAAASSFTVTNANLTLDTLTGGNVVISSAATLDIDAVGIDIDATGASAFTVTNNSLTLNTLTGGNVVIGSAATLDIDAVGIDIDATAASAFTVTGNSLTLNTLTSGNIIIDSIAGIDIDADTTLDIDITGATTIDGTGDITINGSGTGNLILPLSAASSPVSGGVYVDTTNSDFMIHNGTAWLSSTITITSAASNPTSNLRFGDEVYRTDLDEWYKYNGATWTQI